MTTNKSQTNRIDLRINYFYELKQKYWKRRIDKKMNKRLLRRFLSIYFNEVFYIDKPMYFFLGGLVIRVRVGNFVTRQNTYIASSISILWFDRPCPYFFDSVRINLMNGSKAPMAIIRKEWMQTNDVGLLPLIKNKFNDFFEKQQMVRKR